MLRGELTGQTPANRKFLPEDPRAVLNDAVQDPMLLSAFSDWMRQQRGTCATTLANYRRPIVHLRSVPLGGAARLTLFPVVDKIPASIGRDFVVPCDEFFGGTWMLHHSSIADSRPGQLASSAAES